MIYLYIYIYTHIYIYIYIHKDIFICLFAGTPIVRDSWGTSSFGFVDVLCK